jgi:hypothetical protein
METGFIFSIVTASSVTGKSSCHGCARENNNSDNAYVGRRSVVNACAVQEGEPFTDTAAGTLQEGNWAVSHAIPTGRAHASRGTPPYEYLPQRKRNSVRQWGKTCQQFHTRL